MDEVTRCSRCLGFMIYERLPYAYGNGSSSLHQWRCVCCGEIVDDVIIQNRKAQFRADWEQEELYNGPLYDPHLNIPYITTPSQSLYQEVQPCERSFYKGINRKTRGV